MSTARRRTIISAAACLVFNTLAMWSGWHGTDLTTSTLTMAWLVGLVAVFVFLCWHTGDWAFRLPVFLVAITYTSFWGYLLWDLFAHFD